MNYSNILPGTQVWGIRCQQAGHTDDPANPSCILYNYRIKAVPLIIWELRIGRAMYEFDYDEQYGPNCDKPTDITCLIGPDKEHCPSSGAIHPYRLCGSKFIGHPHPSGMANIVVMDKEQIQSEAAYVRQFIMNNYKHVRKIETDLSAL